MSADRDLQRELDRIAEKHRGLIAEAAQKQARITQLSKEWDSLKGTKRDDDYEFQPWQPLRNAKRAYRKECQEAIWRYMDSAHPEPEEKQ